MTLITPQAIGALEGPFAEFVWDGDIIHIYAKPGHRTKIQRGFGKVARSAYEFLRAFPQPFNPCFVPLDVDEKGNPLHEGGPYVYAHITLGPRPPTKE